MKKMRKDAGADSTSQLVWHNVSVFTKTMLVKTKKTKKNFQENVKLTCLWAEVFIATILTNGVVQKILSLIFRCNIASSVVYIYTLSW